MAPRFPPSTTRRALLGCCAAGAAGVAGCSTLGQECPELSGTPSSTDWPQRYRDLGNTNAAPESPDALSEQWSVRVDARLDRPVVADGTVYTIAVSDDRPFETRILAYDLDTGERLWEFSMAEDNRARIAAASDGRVYAIGESAGARERRLSAVDEPGSIAWTFDAEAITGVAAAGEVVFVSVLHGSIVALDAADGRRCARLHPADWPWGRWLSGLTPVGQPAVVDGTVVAPVARYDVEREDDYFEDRIVAFDPTGGTRWESPVLDAFVVDDLAAVGDTVYVPVTQRADESAVGKAASLHALEAASGERRWEKPVGSEFISTAAAREDVVLVAGDGVQAFEPGSGERRWRSDELFGPPIVAGDRVYGRRTEGEFVDTVVAAALETGEPTASHTFDYQVNRAPVFADGRAIVRTLEYENTDDGTEHVADRLHALR